MNHEQVVATIIERGGRCDEVRNLASSLGLAYREAINEDRLDKWRNCWSNASDKGESDITVRLSPQGLFSGISFDCSVVGTCGLSVDEVFAALKEHSIIPASASADRGNGTIFYSTEAEGSILIGEDYISLGVDQERLSSSVNFD